MSDRVEGREAMSQALQILSEEEREAVALRYGADLTVPEIAKLTGEKLTTVEGRVYRALRKLREELGSADEPQPVARRPGVGARLRGPLRSASKPSASHSARLREVPARDVGPVQPRGRGWVYEGGAGEGEGVA